MKPNFQAKSPGADTQSNSHKPGKSAWKCYYCGSNTRHFFRSKCPTWKNLCKKCGFKGHFEQYCGKIPPMLKRQSKTVQEIKTNASYQNTGKIQNEVDIVNMIRSLGLHEQCEAKKDSQLRQHLHVQELNILHGHPQLPVFKAPVHPTDISVVWEICQDIMNIETFVATEIRAQPSMVELNMITIHDVESKCALYSYCTIAGHAVKVKQDMGAEINIMSKHIFEKISNGVKSQIVLNKAKTTQITGYGKNPIGYLGTCVLAVKHNDVQRDVLFFITDVDDDNVILGAKACQQFKLVEILCDEQCQCKLM